MWNKALERKALAAPPSSFSSTVTYSKLTLLVGFGTAVCLQGVGLVMTEMCVCCCKFMVQKTHDTWQELCKLCLYFRIYYLNHTESWSLDHLDTKPNPKNKKTWTGQNRERNWHIFYVHLCLYHFATQCQVNFLTFAASFFDAKLKNPGNRQKYLLYCSSNRVAQSVLFNASVRQPVLFQQRVVDPF